MRTARAARAVQLSGACVRANKERGYPSVENFWNDLNKLLSDFYKVTVYKGRWVQYLEGLGMTIALAALACLIGVCIGVLVALVKYYAGGKKSFGWKTVNAACGIYVTVIRGTPIVVQLLIAYTSGAASLPSTPDRRRQGEASGFPRARRCGSSCCRRRSKIFCPHCSTSSSRCLKRPVWRDISPRGI